MRPPTYSNDPSLLWCGRTDLGRRVLAKGRHARGGRTRKDARVTAPAFMLLLLLLELVGGEARGGRLGLLLLRMVEVHKSLGWG